MKLFLGNAFGLNRYDTLIFMTNMDNCESYRGYVIEISMNSIESFTYSRMMRLEL